MQTFVDTESLQIILKNHRFSIQSNRARVDNGIGWDTLCGWEAKHLHNHEGLEMEPSGKAQEGAATEQLVTHHA